MPIPITCPQCGATYTVPDEKAGQTGRCRCGSNISIPQLAAAPPPPPPAPVAPIEAVVAAEDEDDWVVEDVSAPGTISAIPQPVAPASAFQDEEPPPEEAAVQANVGQRPTVQKLSYWDGRSMAYGLGISFGTTILLVALIAAASGDKEPPGAAIAFAVILGLGGLLAAIAGGSQQFVVSTVPTTSGGALTVIKRMFWMPYSQKRFRIDPGGKLSRTEESAGGKTDIAFIVIVLLLLAAGAVPGLLFFWLWMDARNSSVVSLTLVARGSQTPVKLFSALANPNRPKPQQISDLENLLKPIVGLRRR